MTRVGGFNSHRWIILIVFHVAFIVLLRPAYAQSGQDPEPGHASTKTTIYAVLITVFFLAGLLLAHIRRCTRPNPEFPGGNFLRRDDDDCSRKGGLENGVVESFPVFAYSIVKESKIGNNDLECAICLNEFEDRETVRLLPICNHLFHIDCIDAWLHSHATCPVCRSDLTATKSVKIDGSSPPVTRDHVAIDVEDGGDTEVKIERPISGKFSRSNTTGHSIDDGGVERFTLRLPEDVKRQIMTTTTKTRSFHGDLTVER